MLAKKLIANTASICVVSIIISSCAIDNGHIQTPSSQEIDKSINRALDGVLNSVGISSYTLNPDFIRIVLPLISNISGFTAFMDKYKNKKDFSEKEKLDVVIQLGFLSYAPQFLSKNTIERIDFYYPGLRVKHTFLRDISRDFALNEQRNVISDVPIYTAAADTPTIPIIIGNPGSVSNFANIIAMIELVETSLAPILAVPLLTSDSVQTINQKKEEICSKGKCEKIENIPVVDVIVAEGDSGLRGKWECTASCNIHVIDTSKSFPGRVKGYSQGPSEEIACTAAKRIATQAAPLGSYARHCKCDCAKR